MKIKSANAVYEYEWNKKYTIDEKDYHKQLSGDWEYYKQIKETDYATIYNCVEHAIKEGNHTAFAHFFLKEERSRKVILGKTIKKMIDQQSGIPGFSDTECYYEAPVIKHNYWRSNEFIFTQENINSKTKGAKKETNTIKYQKQTIETWIDGKAKPKRDVVIQMAICLGISIDDTNKLLHSAGYASLYVLDLVDVCSMFTLRSYVNDYTITPFEKLKTTKEQINKALKACLMNNMVTIPVDDFKLLGSRKPLGWDIDNEISSIKKALDGEEIRPADSNITLTSYLTATFKEKFDGTDNIDDFIGFNNQGISVNHAFLQKYYGFLRRTKMFIERTEKYEKNLKYTDWALNEQGVNNIDFSAFPITSSYVSSSRNLKKELVRINQIWQIADIVGEDGYEFTNGDDWILAESKYGALTIPAQIIEGRKTKSSKEENGSVYEMNFGDKLNLMKFAIATGNEDEAGKYLQLAGVWERDWYEDIKKRKELPELLDRSDCLLLYALLYRDQLIAKWRKDKDQVYASQLHTSFPMIKLFLTINRDITYVIMKLCDMKGEKRTYWGKEIMKCETDLFRLYDDMIYPIAWYFREKKRIPKTLQLRQGEIDNMDKYLVGLWRWAVMEQETERK